jgi:hypothetical protein
MGLEAIKLELIEWLTKLDDQDTIQYLKVVKDSSSDDRDWWDTLSKEQKQGVERGVKDLEDGRITTHEEVKKRYGL